MAALLSALGREREGVRILCEERKAQRRRRVGGWWRSERREGRERKGQGKDMERTRRIRMLGQSSHPNAPADSLWSCAKLFRV
jgi:hypothetical protein